MNLTAKQLHSATTWLLRIALAGGFLSAVADRFGVWGSYGSPGVAWGDWSHFRAYSDLLNGWQPAALRPASAVSATLAEALLGIGLLTRWFTPVIATLSGGLLLVFAITMTLVIGPKPPLDYSVWTAAGGAFALALLSRKTSAR